MSDMFALLPSIEKRIYLSIFIFPDTDKDTAPRLSGGLGFMSEITQNDAQKFAD